MSQKFFAANAPRRDVGPGALKPGAREVSGTLVEKTIFGVWARGKVALEGGALVTVTGHCVADLEEGMDYRFSGSTTNHPRFGWQFEAQVAEPDIRPNTSALINFIKRKYEGVGEKSARKFVQAILTAQGVQGLEALRQQLLRKPWTVDFSSVGRKGKYTASEDEESMTAFVYRHLATRLSGVEGLKDGVLKALAGYLVGRLPARKGAAALPSPEPVPVPGVPPARPATPAAPRPPGPLPSPFPLAHPAPTSPVGSAAAALPNAANDAERDPVEDAWSLLADDPYEPICHVPGYGFLSADTIGRTVNIAFDAPQRLGALAAHALQEYCERAGHVFLTRDQFDASIVQIDRRLDAELVISHALKSGSVALDEAPEATSEPDSRFDEMDAADPAIGQVEDGFADVDRYYRPALLRAETSLATSVARMVAVSKPLMNGSSPDPHTDASRHLRGRIDLIGARTFKGGLDDLQADALQRIVSSRVRLHTLTAGPGCGKTALMEVLVQMLPDKQFLFCAPTGKAAKVLSNRLESKGYLASTIHSMLRGSGPGDFSIDSANPLEGDILVVDESSMPDLATAAALFEAVPEHMHVIMLGDWRQLPSIQPGRVLMDLLKVPEIDHSHLAKPYRNSGGILEVVDEIGNGELSIADRPSVSFSRGLDEASVQFRDVMAAYTAEIARHGIANVMLMLPKRVGKPDDPGWNTTYANAVLRDVVNPNGQKVPGTQFRVGDRIVIRKNMRIEQPGSEEEMQVVNGDTGTIRSFSLNNKPDARGKRNSNAGAEFIGLNLDDGRVMQFPGAASNELNLAFAMTVHASQGSEYKSVIVVVTPGHPAFMNRNMFFTAASRARARLQIFGDDDVLARVARTPLPARNSALIDRIRLELDDDGDVQEAVPRPACRA